MSLPPEEKKQIENEMLFRRINEKVGSDLDDLDGQHVADGNPELVRDDELVLHFKCECSDEDCSMRVPMRLSDYTKLHVQRSTFLISPNHEVENIEKVLEATDGYSVVIKNNTTPEPKQNAEFNQTDTDNSRS